MNISEAKAYIKDSVNLYLKKDEFGDYKIPVVRQRPIFLLGAPGIGKTAIMEQIADELGIALVSYSMTHHTRQSALGLPFIKQKNYGGVNYDVSEYTMSEIIASVYETMEESGVREGILFLDEINCVSETLAPSMLQFLQYKVFGKHSVPEGWVIVTAGNPPEYNKSVREFDVVTMDRLKVLNVQADYNTWKIYARERGIHSSILNFLELKKEYFYHMETVATGRTYVTARGWEDLSQIISLYEESNLKVDETLIGQYLMNDQIVREYCAYYDLYNKYKNDYQVEQLLSGNCHEQAAKKVGNASFDERLSLLGLLMDTIMEEMKEVIETAEFLKEMLPGLKAIKTAEDSFDMLLKQKSARQNQLMSRQRAGALLPEEKRKYKRIIAFLSDAEGRISEEKKTGIMKDSSQIFNDIKNSYDSLVEDMKLNVKTTGERIHNVFEFTAIAFSDGNNEDYSSPEMLVLVTEMTVSKYASAYISMFGSEDYIKYSQLLMVTERQSNLKTEISQLLTDL